MGPVDDPDDIIFKRHQELCSNLNMDRNAADQAWQSYQTIRENYSLEGDQLHWIGCALYFACRKSFMPSVGRTSTMIEGNCVSLTQLLKACQLSLIQFFNKSRKWADMANMPPEFRDKIDKLERNFAVSMVIFKRYQPIFSDIFLDPADDLPRQQRTKKNRIVSCTPSKLFDFTWTLFVYVKCHIIDISEDLVNSYHLLLACLDMIFSNAVLADRKDILKPNFPGLPANFMSEDNIITDPPCIINNLCEKHNGIPVEAKSIKEYCWNVHLKRLFEKKILRGDPNNFSGLLESNTFEANCKAINKQYEDFVLSTGDFDERIFLGDRADNDIGTPTKISGLTELTEKMEAKRYLCQQYGSALTPATPLTGRKYLKSKDIHNSDVTPVSTATQSVSRLQTFLVGRQNSPSEVLIEIFKTCKQDPTEKIKRIIKELGDLFCTQYNHHVDEQSGQQIDFARKRLQLAECLYYKLLECILLEEKKLRSPKFDFTALLDQDLLHHALFACCLEIVIYSYNSQRTFPWILEALNLEAYHFYKVLEIIARIEEPLSRDVVKHLNLIEEQVLESMAWKSDSPLWENLKKSDLIVPCFEDVCLPEQLQDSPSGNTSVQNIAPGTSNPPNSPVASVSDRFQSPITPSTLTKKRLILDGTTLNSSVVRQVKPGQSVLQTANKPSIINIQAIEGENGERYFPIPYLQNTGSVIIKTQASNVPAAKQAATNKEKRPKRTGSLGLFFRKFYNLASVRMQEICSHLELNDLELRRKIWTFFEHSIIHHTELMQDRHLDQILMCAIYVICKVTQNDKTFTDIMRCYRFQPQAASHVYRSVLFSKLKSGTGSSTNGKSKNSTPTQNIQETKDETKEKDNIRSSSTLPIASSAPLSPTNLACSSNCFESEERGDLIKFYNFVYVQKIEACARKLSNKAPQNETLPLSPLPVGKGKQMSPVRRISDKHSVFIRALDGSLAPSSPTQHLSYCFSRSPAKDLMAINNMIKVDTRKVGKRLLVDDGPEDVSQPKRPSPTTNKVQEFIGQCQSQD